MPKRLPINYPFLNPSRFLPKHFHEVVQIDAIVSVGLNEHLEFINHRNKAHTHRGCPRKPKQQQRPLERAAIPLKNKLKRRKIARVNRREISFIYKHSVFFVSRKVSRSSSIRDVSRRGKHRKTLKCILPTEANEATTKIRLTARLSARCRKSDLTAFYIQNSSKK